MIATAVRYIPIRGILTKDEAQTFGETLERLKEDGKATPADIVEEARPEESAIHGLFCWDDTEAGEKWRQHQASHYCRSITIVEVKDGKAVQTRAFQNVKVAEETATGAKRITRQYVSTTDVMANQDYAEQVVSKALRELEGWRQRYSEYKLLFGGVFSAIDEALDLVATKKQKVDFHKRLKEVRKKKGIPADREYKE